MQDLPEEALKMIVMENGNNNEDGNPSDDDYDHEYDYGGEDVVYIFKIKFKT